MARFLIIAASSAIGQSVVEQLVNVGHTVITTARNDSKIKPDYYLEASDFQAVDEVFSKVGELDGVLNCSGSLLLKSAHTTTEAEYHSVIQSSLSTAFATVRSSGKYMTQGGSVVLMASAAARIGLPHHEAIAAAKAGIIGLMLSGAATYAGMNLRFNVVAPGLIESPLTASITTNPLLRKASESMHALGRLGKPIDVANAIVFLLDPQNSWMTGQVLGVDGGLGSILSKPKKP
ncbi:MAG: SDR family oxidoreductase [Gammaproteobacteria bacterium]|nr:SDR family oxidoreductase [Gammaproteobacteria bacterium]MBP9728878.1 SDR family oxidoreductase [Gammaproteobacteria bacterium]